MSLNGFSRHFVGKRIELPAPGAFLETQCSVRTFQRRSFDPSTQLPIFVKYRWDSTACNTGGGIFWSQYYYSWAQLETRDIFDAEVVKPKVFLSVGGKWRIAWIPWLCRECGWMTGKIELFFFTHDFSAMSRMFGCFNWEIPLVFVHWPDVWVQSLAIEQLSL